MKKSVIFLTLLLVGSIAGTYAVYELYVKARMKELGEHLEEERQLKDKIGSLEETFFKTKPDTVLRVWRSEIQPWADAVDRRADFFNLGEVPLKVEIPEEQKEIVKFYYKDVQPEKVRALEAKAWESNISIPDPTFGTPNPDRYGQGANPSPEEISGHLARFEFGESIVDLMIDARAKRVDVLEIWPERVEMSGRSGDIKSHTTGLSFTISMRDFVGFLDKLSQQDRYFEVKALWLSNTTLLEPNADLNVQIVLAQAYYEPATEAREAMVAEGSSVMQGLFANLFGAKPQATTSSPDRSNKKTWWQKFRQKYLPF